MFGQVFDEGYFKGFSEAVSISRKGGGFERQKIVDGEITYHYRHALKTHLDPGLLVLRTTPHFRNAESCTLNGGHKAKEFVYVLLGSVGMVWATPLGVIRIKELNFGDSVYIDSWVPHAFYSIEDESEIVAIDYL